MRTISHRRRLYRGYSLGEMLAALVIGAMVLTSILGIYGRANQASEAVARKIDSPALGWEVLQLIAEDVDRMANGTGAVIEMKNGVDNGFARAELVLRRTFFNGENAEQTLEEIIWRAGYDYDSGALAIYRSYSGLAPEDRLLDSKREDWEANYPFVPICRGVTFFHIEVTNGEQTSDTWSGTTLPPGLTISLSFAPAYETVGGVLDVEETKKINRAIAIERMRAVRFTTSPTSNESNANDGRTSQPTQIR